MRAKINKKTPIEIYELDLIGGIANTLYLLAFEHALPRQISEQLLSMRLALKTVLLAHGRRKVKSKIKKDGTVDEWPNEVSERWEAIK